LFGFFGDHWQKIYNEGCGAIDHSSLRKIGKHANFRSVQTIVDCLNRMRPQLTQFAEDPDSRGEVVLLHTNHWKAERRTGAHWGGDLPEADAQAAFEGTCELLKSQGWDFAMESTKVLMLTHRALALEQGYSSLPAIFRFNESFVKKENKLIEFLVDSIEPAFDAFTARRYGAMFDALGRKTPLIRTQDDKSHWTKAMQELAHLRGWHGGRCCSPFSIEPEAPFTRCSRAHGEGARPSSNSS
jgi:DNA helicase-2/ATP-dependent DNA helicase PcrA